MSTWNLDEVQPGQVIKADHIKEASNNWQGDVAANNNALTGLGALQFNEVSAPTTPPTDKVAVYVDTSDGKLKLKKDSGTVVDLEAGGGGATDLDDLTDVTITSPSSNQAVLYNGSAWVNAQVNHTHLSNIGTNTHAQIDTHIASTSNPHSVTATQVGLGNVQNYGIASQAEAEAGSASNKYMTPQRVAQAIAALGTGEGVGESLWSASGDDVYYNDGNVGIGTDTPTVPLDVTGEVKFTTETGYSGGVGGFEFFANNNIGAVRLTNNSGSSTLELAHDPANPGWKLDTFSHQLNIDSTHVRVNGADTAPSSEVGSLHISGDGETDTKRLGLGYNGTGDYGWLQSTHNGVDYTPLVLNGQAGTVVIGTTTMPASPGNKGLFVSGKSIFKDITPATGATEVVIQAGEGQEDTSVTQWIDADGYLTFIVAGDGTMSAMKRTDAVRTVVLFGGLPDVPPQIGLGSTAEIVFKNTESWDAGARDTGIARNAAGVIEINTGTTGSLGSITANTAILPEIEEPSTPASGMAVVFVDEEDGEVKVKKDSGTVVSLEGGGGSSVTTHTIWAPVCSHNENDVPLLNTAHWSMASYASSASPSLTSFDSSSFRYGVALFPTDTAKNLYLRVPLIANRTGDIQIELYGWDNWGSGVFKLDISKTYLTVGTSAFDPSKSFSDLQSVSYTSGATTYRKLTFSSVTVPSGASSQPEMILKVTRDVTVGSNSSGGFYLYAARIVMQSN